MAHLDPLNVADIEDADLQRMLKRYLDIRKSIPNGVLTLGTNAVNCKSFRPAQSGDSL